MPPALPSVFTDKHVLRKYEITQKLGKGAYAVVFKAVDKKTKETVRARALEPRLAQRRRRSRATRLARRR